jgi:hypothetical protein
MHCEEAERAVEGDVDGRDPEALFRWCACAFQVERSDAAASKPSAKNRANTSCAPRETYSGTGLSSGRCDSSGSVTERSPNTPLCVSRSWRVRISKDGNFRRNLSSGLLDCSRRTVKPGAPEP